jgi:hypothetical protein
LYVLGIVAFALAAGIALAAPVQPPDEVVIDAAAAKKGPVTFPHKAHTERTECVTCHHTSEGLMAGADMEVKACSECHLDPEGADVPGMREMSMKKNPFHMLCIDCHKKEAKGPTKCDDCHKK